MKQFVKIAAFCGFFFLQSFSYPTKNITVLLVTEQDNDTEFITAIHTTLLSAEKVSKIAGFELIHSDDPIRDDIYVFALKTEQEQKLVMQIFDEEGYEQVGHAQIQTTHGKNYRGLNVRNLEDGAYVLKFVDEEGNTHSSQFRIEK